MEFILLAASASSDQTAPPLYLLKVGKRLIPVTRESLERLGMLRDAARSERLHREE